MFIAMKFGRGMLIAATMQYCVYSDVPKVSTVIHCASSESVGLVISPMQSGTPLRLLWKTFLFKIPPFLYIHFAGPDATISGYVQIWVLAVAVGGSVLVTAIVVIAIVLVVVCICSKRKKGYEVDRTNGLSKNEYPNAMYTSESK